MSKIRLYKRIPDLVDMNNKIDRTRENDIKVLRELMYMARDGVDYSDNFMPNLFTKVNQKKMIDKMNEYYKDEYIDVRRRIISKLICYLKMYEEIDPDDYNKYKTALEDLNKQPDKVRESEMRTYMSIYELIMGDEKLDRNIRLYAYMMYNEMGLKPKDLVRITYEESENYIDLINKRIIVDGKEMLRDINSMDILKILLPGRTEIMYKRLLKDRDLLISELKMKMEKYLFESGRRCLSSQDLSKMMSYMRKKLSKKLDK
jgi:hypothetical protein